MAAAIRLLPLLRPATAHNSRTRFNGGNRPPATVAKICCCSAVSGKANAAQRTVSQVCHDDRSPSAAANKRLSRKARSIVNDLFDIGRLAHDFGQRLRYIDE